MKCFMKRSRDVMTRVDGVARDRLFAQRRQGLSRSAVKGEARHLYSRRETPVPVILRIVARRDDGGGDCGALRERREGEASDKVHA